MKNLPIIAGLAVAGAAALFAGAAVAKVSPEEAAKLGLEGTELTPVGAVRAGNADGSIPAWDGGIPDFSPSGKPDPEIMTPAGLRKYGVR